jgi:hypothetical protein
MRFVYQARAQGAAGRFSKEGNSLNGAALSEQQLSSELTAMSARVS